MKAMRYFIDSSGVKVPEMSIHVDNYQGNNIILFINRKSGAFALDVTQGKERLNLADRNTTEVFDVSDDSYLIIDLLDALKNVHADVTALTSRYLKGSTK
jgi:hypothetical protein